MSAALLLPLIILIAVVIFDMARLFVTSIYAQELVLLAAKIGASQNPQGYAFPTGQLVEMKSHPTENSAVTNKRRAFWAAQLDPGSPLFYGAPFYSDKDKKVLNLMHGFASTLEPDRKRAVGVLLGGVEKQRAEPRRQLRPPSGNWISV